MYHNLSDNYYNSKAYYYCDNDYVFANANFTRCLGNGSWSIGMYCRRKGCQDPGTVPNSGKSPSSPPYLVGVNISFTCDMGYVIQGSDYRTCLESGTWTNQQPSCVKVDCGSPPLVTNGNAAYTTTDYLSIANYSCRDTFSLIGSNQSICQTTKIWSSVPQCHLTHCPTLASPNDTNLISSGNKIGEKYVYACARFSKLVFGSLTRTCGNDGAWSGEAPLCLMTSCPTLSAINNTIFNWNFYSVNRTVLIDCKFSYKRVDGDSAKICDSNGNWLGEDLKCEKIGCSSPPQNGINGTQFEGSEPYEYLKYAKFTCQQPYTNLTMDTKIKCLTNGKWQNSEPLCTPGSCSQPIQVPNTTYTGGTYYNESVKYKCDKGMEFVNGNNEIVCSFTGGILQWTGTISSCKSNFLFVSIVYK